MQKYLYLTKVEWASAWVNGGPVPLSLASKYLGDSRDGIYTPDENLIHESSYDLNLLSPAITFGNVRGISFTGSVANGQPIPEIEGANYYKEDGLIQSFCNVFDIEIAQRLGKSACVRIHDINKLRKYMDKRLGRRSQFGECQYTHDHQRGHFLKSNEDAWQKEYRFFWPITEERSVLLPPSVAEVVWTS